MGQSLSQRVLARLAAYLFLASGVLTCVRTILPHQASMNRPGLLVLGAVSLAIGVVVLVLPWDRWPKRATAWLVVPAFAMVGVGAPLGGWDPYSFGIYFVVVFAWIGVSHRQGVSTMLAPAAAVVYFLSVAHSSHPDMALVSVFEVIPAAVVVGEGLSWVSARLRQAERLDAEHLIGMESLLEATEQLALQSDPEQAASLVARLGTQLTSGTGALVLLSEDSLTFRSAGTYRWAAGMGNSAIEASDEPGLINCLRTGEPVWLPASMMGTAIGRPGRRSSFLFIPVAGSSSAAGCLVVAFRSSVGHLDAFDDRLAMTFARQAGLAFERLHATQLLLDASLQDQLTHLGNRRFAESILKDVRPGDCLVLADLDGFKDVNDTWGHESGDDALTSFAAHLETSLREGDVATRWGGDEFLLILRAAGEQGHQIVERLAEDWHRMGGVPSFTAGVALHRPGAKPAITLSRADEALYRGKRAGRNRVLRYASSADHVRPFASAS